MKEYKQVRVRKITHDIAELQLLKINKNRAKNKQPELSMIDLYHAAMSAFDPRVMK